MDTRTTNVLSLVLLNGVVSVHPVLGGGDDGNQRRVLQAVSKPMQRILCDSIRQALAQYSAKHGPMVLRFVIKHFRPVEDSVQ